MPLDAAQMRPYCARSGWATGHSGGKDKMVTRLEVGDKVRARRTRPVPAGTLGHVQMKLLSVADMYFVQFDGESNPTLMHATEIELVRAAKEHAA